jgi:hypothetical protein
MTNHKDITFDSDRAMSVFGVNGRLTHRTVAKPGASLWLHQRWISEARHIDGYGKDAALRVEMRFDDSCGNGHATFAITAEVRRPKAQDIEAGGCLHDEIAQVFPELQPLIKWHLVSTDGPMHYLANGVFWAECHKCIGRYSKPEDQPKAAEHFASTVVWDHVDDQTNAGLLDGADIDTIKQVLTDRLPRVMAAFRQDMDRTGFFWSPAEFTEPVAR